MTRRRPERAMAHVTRIEAMERRAAALDLRKGGATYRMIRDTLVSQQERAHERVRAGEAGVKWVKVPAKYSVNQAWKDVAHEIDRLNRDHAEVAERVQRMEAERLDRMLLAVWSRVQAGDLDAIAVALRIGERRAKLYGLDRQGPLATLGLTIDDLERMSDTELEELMKRVRAL